MSKICRTCLQVLSDNEGYHLLHTIRNKLLVCVPELSLSDSQQSDIICPLCLEALNTAYDFKNKCLQTEKRILSYSQHSGCDVNGVDITEVVRFDSQHLPDVHFPITEVIESDSELDIKPIIKMEPAPIRNDDNTMYELLNKFPLNQELDIQIRSGHSNNASATTNICENTQNTICTVCQKNFISNSELNSHMVTHKSIRYCTFCYKMFSRRDKLMLHLRTHTGEKPFSCTLCERSFSRKDKLNRHMQTHSGEKPFKCPLCEKCYTRKDKLKTHMHNQHQATMATTVTDSKVSVNYNQL